MNTSSSDDLREEYGNGDLPFDMELSGLTIHEKLTSPVASPWRSQNASAWASMQGLNGTFARLLQKTSSFDLVPDSSKLVVLDVSLSVNLAFQALRENGIKSAPLWDSEEREYVGVVSISDFVAILTLSYAEATKECGTDVVACDAHVQNHLSQSIAYWRERLNPIPHLIFVTPDDSVFECSAVMLQNNIHRVAVLDSVTHTVMFLMTHSVILSFFLAATSPANRQPVFGKTLVEAGLGDPKKDSCAWFLLVLKKNLLQGLMNDADVIASVSGCLASTPFIEVLRFFEREKCSSVPIIERDGRMVQECLLCCFLMFPTLSFADWHSHQERHSRTCKGRNLEFFESISWRLAYSQISR